MRTSFPCRFHTEGNRILDPAGNVTVFRGLNVVDPVLQASAEAPELGTWEEAYYAEVSRWGADIVRVPLGPLPWRHNGVRRLAVLDRTLDWIGGLGMYAILDFHSIGFPPDGHYADTGYGPDAHATDEEEMREFWQTLSARYADNHVVAFYELFNEPVAEGRKGTEGDWRRWRAFCEGIVDVIRANDTQKPVIVGGLDFAHDLSFVPAQPVERPDVVYATHVYPERTGGWDERFGRTAEQHPVFCTELGFVLDPAGFDASYALETLYGPEGRFRSELMTYLEGRRISWTAWCFVVQWGPGLLAGRGYAPNQAGAFFREQLLLHRSR
ncbi:MAG: hypothetical protein AMK73_02625 [Planctomycetes bacterium SM23_32]|nr:MAG: hypothetical protein AMK73_02625 [Planctomycetes bacterium SM23_32]